MTVRELLKQLRSMTYEEFDGLELINNTSYEIKVGTPFITYDVRHIDTECYDHRANVKTYDRMTRNTYSWAVVKITFLFVDDEENFYESSKYRKWLKEMPTQKDFAVVDVSYFRDLSSVNSYRYRFDAWFRIYEMDSRRLDRIDTVYTDINGNENIIEFYPEEQEETE